MFTRQPCRLSALALATLAFTATHTSHALSFNFVPTATMDAQALSGFQAAGSYWSSVFTDNMVVNINVDFRALSSGVLGQASSSQLSGSYQSFRNALASDATSAIDQLAINSLPIADNFNLMLNYTSDNPNGAGSPTPYLDNNNNNNNRFVRATSANLKALSLINPFAPAIDASIAFSSAFTWDFARVNGITAGSYDFVAVAVHEIGHALGFISGVDALDTNSPNSQGAFSSETAFRLTPLDLFRYSAESNALGVVDFSADTRAKYFSIDGGLTSLGRFSTGRVHGDRNQASHLRSQNPSIGIMDPSLASGELGIVTPLDLIAFDTIGYNLANPVPEPSTYALFGTALLGVAIYLRRRKTT